MKNMRGEEVVRILRELVLREGSAHLVYGRRANDEQQDATDDFEDAVEALEDDCDREGSVEPVTALEPVHRVRAWRGSGTASPSDGSCHRVSSAAGFRVELAGGDGIVGISNALDRRRLRRGRWDHRYLSIRPRPATSIAGSDQASHRCKGDLPLGALAFEPHHGNQAIGPPLVVGKRGPN